MILNGTQMNYGILNDVENLKMIGDGMIVFCL